MRSFPFIFDRLNAPGDSLCSLCTLNDDYFEPTTLFFAFWLLKTFSSGEMVMEVQNGLQCN